MALGTIIELLIGASDVLSAGTTSSARSAGKARGSKRARVEPVEPAQQPLPSAIRGEELGVRLDSGALVARGDGHTLALEPEGAEGGAIAHGKLHSILDTPLDLGLRITRRVFAPIASAGLCGDPQLDDELDFEADEPVRLRQLLADGPLRGVLRQLSHDGDWSEITDRGIARRFALTERAEMAGWVARVRPLLLQLQEARSRVQPAEALRDLVEPWKSFAAANQLRYGDVPLRIARAADGFEVSLAAVRVGKRRYAFELTARFDQANGLGLTVRKAHLGDRIGEWFGRKDVQLGDEPFDAAFEVRVDASREQRARGVLASAARVDCLGLGRDFDELQINDVEVRATAGVWSAHLLDAIDIAERLAAGIVAGARGDNRQLPYR